MRNQVISYIISGCTCAQIDALLGTRRGYARRVADESGMAVRAKANDLRYRRDTRRVAMQATGDALRQAFSDAAKTVARRYRERVGIYDAAEAS